jgi:hypothetical protein
MSGRINAGLYGGFINNNVSNLFVPGGSYRSGQRIGFAMGVNFNAVTPVASDTMYAFPIPVYANCLISGVALQVGTAVAGVSAKLGLALSGPDGRPGALVAEAPTPVNMNTAADTELVALFSAAQFVPAGVLWGLAVFNGAAQPVTIGNFDLPAPFVGIYNGPTTIQSFTVRGSTGVPVRNSRTQTYASAFPSTLTGWTAASAIPSSPVMVAIAA